MTGDLVIDGEAFWGKGYKFKNMKKTQYGIFYRNTTYFTSDIVNVL
jgi:hypothetical protein